jgi:HSP20 family protein
MSLLKWESVKDIEDLFERYTRSLPWARSQAWPGVGDWNPRVDISESDGTYQLKADIPGVNKEDVKVSLDHGVLTIQGERRQENKEDSGRFHRMERFYGSFSRSFTLPEDAEDAGLKAHSENGQLTITVPRKATVTESNAVQIPVD